MTSEGWEAMLHGGNMPVARVKFKYQVNGVSYLGKQSWADGPLPPQPGSAVTVYYNPVRPENSVIEPSATSNNLVFWAYLLVIVAIGLFAVALAQTF